MSTPKPSVPRRYRRYVGLFAVAILAVIIINTIVTKPNRTQGIEPGHTLPPFAVPLALGDLVGDADVATRADQGSAGRVPACQERGSQILNVCALYERGPVVLALFADIGSCPEILGELQMLAPSFPGVQFAAVAINGDRGQLRRLMLSRGVRLPVGIDRDGAVAALYNLGTCSQVTFAYPGGLVQSSAILNRPAPATLRARVSALLAASRVRGWRG